MCMCIYFFMYMCVFFCVYIFYVYAFFIFFMCIYIGIFYICNLCLYVCKQLVFRKKYISECLVSLLVQLHYFDFWKSEALQHQCKATYQSHKFQAWHGKKCDCTHALQHTAKIHYRNTFIADHSYNTPCSWLKKLIFLSDF